MLYIFHAVVFYTLILFSTTAQSLVFALPYVSATCCSHHRGVIILRGHKQHIMCQCQ
jgi:hypothetical protein